MAAMTMRPEPDDVDGWFATPVSETALLAYVDLLRDDPNWEVLLSRGVNVYTLDLHYGPHGVWYTITLMRQSREADVLWRRV